MKIKEKELKNLRDLFSEYFSTWIKLDNAISSLPLSKERKRKLIQANNELFERYLALDKKITNIERRENKKIIGKVKEYCTDNTFKYIKINYQQLLDYINDYKIDAYKNDKEIRLILNSPKGSQQIVVVENKKGNKKLFKRLKDDIIEDRVKVNLQENKEEKENEQ